MTQVPPRTRLSAFARTLIDDADAATPPVIDPANDLVATGDMLRIDCDGAGTGAKGLIVELQFQ